MKGNVIADAAVQDVLKQFIIAELYTDKPPHAEENNRLLKERFNSVALPVYATVGPDGKIRSQLEGRSSIQEFIQFLKKGLDGKTGMK